MAVVVGVEVWPGIEPRSLPTDIGGRGPLHYRSWYESFCDQICFNLSVSTKTFFKDIRN